MEGGEVRGKGEARLEDGVDGGLSESKGGRERRLGPEAPVLLPVRC